MSSKFKVGDFIVEKEKYTNNPDLSYIEIKQIDNTHYYFTCVYKSNKSNWDNEWEINDIDNEYRKLTKLEQVLK